MRPRRVRRAFAEFEAGLTGCARLASFRHQVLQLAVIFVCGVTQLSVGAYFLRRDLFPCIEAVSPAYIGTVTPTVSGSSVATALAVGIASLALLLLRTYNDLEDRDMRPFYTKEGIMPIFKKMDADKGGIQLSKLFPRETVDENSTRKILAKNWNISNFPE